MRKLIFFISLSTFSSFAFAQDRENGETLHMEKCTGCHGAEIYTRQNKKVTSLPKLGTQVRFCKDNLGITWFDDEVNDVIHYLNTEYYKFK